MISYALEKFKYKYRYVYVIDIDKWIWEHNILNSFDILAGLLWSLDSDNFKKVIIFSYTLYLIISEPIVYFIFSNYF